MNKLLETTAEQGAVQGDEGVGYGDGPMHASPFAAYTDHGLASGFDDACGGTESLGPEIPPEWETISEGIFRGPWLRYPRNRSIATIAATIAAVDGNRRR